MNYTTKRIEEVYENDELVSVSFAVCMNNGTTGATKEVSVPDLEAYLADKAGTLKALALETAAGLEVPEILAEKEVVLLEEVTITKKDVDEKKVEIEEERIAEEERKIAEEAAGAEAQRLEEERVAEEEAGAKSETLEENS